MIIAVDFDGVIHDYKNPIPGRKMGAPMEGAKQGLEYFRRNGFKIIVFTVWGGTDQGKKTIKDFMNYYILPFNEITNIKPQADYYLDDKAIRFTSWKDLKI